jgi:hypothetical protein
MSLGSLRSDVEVLHPGSGSHSQEDDSHRDSENLNKERDDEVLLVNIKLDDEADQSFEDEEVMRTTVYSALCPQSPCQSGLVLEDIRILSLSKDSDGLLAVHLAISPPLGLDSHRKAGSRIEALKEEVASRLLDDGNSLRTDVFGGLIVHSGFVVADAKVLPPATSPNEFQAASKSLVHSKRRQGRVANPAQKQWIAQRDDSNLKLLQNHETSCATLCIAILATLFLFTSVLNVSIERACRWLYPAELESANPMGDTDEFEQIPAQDRDFRMVRAILEVSKVSLGPVVVQASLMFIVQARARELTRGFGDPPKWAQTNMMLLTAADILFVIVTTCEVWFKGSDRIHSMKQALVILYTQPNPVFMSLMTAVHILKSANVWCLVFCAHTLTASECRLPAGVSTATLWPPGTQPPELSIELKICMVFCVQFIIINKMEILMIWWMHLRHLCTSDTAVARSIVQELETNISRYRLLTKTANLAPLCTVITLAIREVHVLVPSDADFRSRCLHILATVMIAYSVFVSFLVFFLPKGRRIEVDELAECVVTLASSTDYIAHGGERGVDYLFRIVRKLLLVTAYTVATILIASVFFLSSDSGPAPTVPWPIMWTLFITFQCLGHYFFCIFHETYIASRESQNGSLRLLSSSLREVEGFMALAPMICLVFINAHARAQITMKSGDLPQWVLTAMNVVAQAMLLQMLVNIFEATVAGALFTNEEDWKRLQGIATPRLSTSDSAFLDSPARLDPLEAGLGQIDDTAEFDSTRVSSGTPSSRAIEEAKRRLEAQAMGSESQSSSRAVRQAFASQSRESRRASSVDTEYELRFLATKFLNLFCTLAQMYLLTTLALSVLLVLIATLSLDSDVPRRTYSSGDWRSSIFPLLPVSAPTSTTMETMVWFVALFFAIKGSASFLLSCRYLYAAVKWSSLNAFHSCGCLVDLVPLLVLLCLMAESRADYFHGFKSEPPYFVQLHMVMMTIAMTVQIIAHLSVPAFTGELTMAEGKAQIIPGIRLIFLLIESMAACLLHWCILVVIIGIAIMRPEDVVLSSGATGLPWRGSGKPPKLPLIAWNMWALCIMVFVVSGLQQICHHLIVRRRYAEGQVQGFANRWKGDDEWFARNKKWRVLIWHHALTLARQTALGSVMLAALFIPLELLIMPQPGESTPRLVQEGKISEQMLGFLKMLFFVATLTLIVRTFLVFCFGCFKPPTLGEVFRDEAPAQYTHEEPMLERPISHDFDTTGPEAVSPLAVAFKRLALAVTACEGIVISTLGITLFVQCHQHLHIFSTGGWLNGSIYLFVTYLVVHLGWGFWVLLGRQGQTGLRHKRFDGILDVASVCPLILILYMNCRERTLEVAGRHGVTPEWMQHLIFAASIIILAELAVVMLAPNSVAQAQKSAALNQRAHPDGEMLSTDERRATLQKETFFNRNIRVTYLVTRSLLKISLYACAGAIIFGLFWMTEEQALQAA